LEQIQIKVFTSTLLFVLALSISKCSILLFLHQAAGNAFQRLAIIVIGVLILLWTLAVMAIIILECEMPTPWQIWTSKCIPLVSTSLQKSTEPTLITRQLPFWITAIAVDIFIDIGLTSLSAQIIWTSRLESRQKALATLISSLRLL
jgi:hypothetical protein